MKKQLQRYDTLLEQLKDVGRLDWSLTEEKMHKYMDAHNICTWTAREPKHLAECPICHKVYNRRQIYAHINNEKKRKGNLLQYKDADKMFRCKVPGCTSSPKTRMDRVKDHMLDHSPVQLQEAGYDIEVSSTTII